MKGPTIKDGRGNPIKRSGPALLSDVRREKARKKAARRGQPEPNRQMDAAALEAQRLSQARGLVEQAASLLGYTKPHRARALRAMLDDL